MRGSSTETVAIAGMGWRLALKAMELEQNPANLVSLHALEDAPEPDWLVCYGDAPDGLTTNVSKEQRIIVVSEPPGVMRYHPAFLDQFGVALSPFPLAGFRGRLLATHPAIPWFYGCRFGDGRPASWRLSAAELLAMPAPAKENIVSIVLSRKAMTPLHRARLAFVEILERRFSGSIRIFGSGFTPIDDKAEAIDPARFHLALENTRHDDYWTEKLSDALIGWALPIYDGAPNVGRYIDPAAYRPLDVTDIERGCRLVGALLEDGDRAVDLAALHSARVRILRDHSLPALLHRTIPLLGGAEMKKSPRRQQTLLKNKAFSFKQRMKRFFSRGGGS